MTISAFDGANLMPDKGVEYTFGAGISVSPESISWGGTLTIKLSDTPMSPRKSGSAATTPIRWQ